MCIEIVIDMHKDKYRWLSRKIETHLEVECRWMEINLNGHNLKID